jgi:leucyl/phenylalanyl-tRNA--protein transferase
MVAMMEQAEKTGIQLIDVQVANPHTISMGAIEIPRVEYIRRLGEAIKRTVLFASTV